MTTATATESTPTHHLTLSDGTTTYGLVLVDSNGLDNPRAITKQALQRTSLKTAQGTTEYADLEEPFISIIQKDWSGGRGQEDFEDDRSRFMDSKHAMTWFDGQIMIGPQSYYASGHRSLNQSLPGNLGWEAHTASKRYFANKFTPTANYTAANIYIWLRRPNYNSIIYSVGLYTDSAGEPGSVISGATGAITDSDISDHSYDSGLVGFGLGTPAALTSGTTYWVVVFNALEFPEVGGNPTRTNGLASADGTTWVASSQDMYSRVTDAGIEAEFKFFEYKKALYAITFPDDGTASKLYLNGDRGAADSNSGDKSKLNDATKSWTTNEWANAVAIITRGTGAEERLPWRTISSNTATALTVAPNWNVAHDTTTEYVIVGTSKWQEITGHGLTVPVTDVLVSKDKILFAQGDYLSTASPVDMRRARFYNNAGTWTAAYASEGSKARWLAQTWDPVDGLVVWRGLNDEGTGEIAVAKGIATTYSAGSISFGADIEIGNDRDELITGLENYGSPETLWILTTSGIWRIVNDVAERVPIREMNAVRSELNGHAHLVHGVYLYFSLLHSVERYYDNNLDDMGPSRDAGLPSERQGPVSAFVGYPGIFFASIDAGQSKKSSTLVWNQRGWHEVYRAHFEDAFAYKAKRIRNLYIQPIPGAAVDRLWYSEGADIAYMNLPSNTFNPSHDENFRFHHEGHVITSWMYAGLQDVQKLFKSMKIFAEGLSAGNQIVQIDYQTDGDTLASQWTTVSGDFDTVPVEEVDLSSTDNVTGRRIRFRIRLTTNDNTKTPKVKAIVLEALGRISTKYRYSFVFRAADEDTDIEGDEISDYTRVETLTAKLEDWANSATALTMRCIYSPYDNKTVLLDPTSLRPVRVIADDQIEVHVGQAVVIEI